MVQNLSGSRRAWIDLQSDGRGTQLGASARPDNQVELASEPATVIAAKVSAAGVIDWRSPATQRSPRSGPSARPTGQWRRGATHFTLLHSGVQNEAHGLFGSLTPNPAPDQAGIKGPGAISGRRRVSAILHEPLHAAPSAWVLPARC